MLILLTSGNPLGLSAVGSGGRTAVSSFEQITRTLRQGLGPAHAALFAEPSRRSGRIDWFAEGDGGRKPVRLIAAAPEVREPALHRLNELVRDIRRRIAELQGSDRSDERILGEMIAHALEIPTEDAVFLLGDQPVMTFWGYVSNEGRPPVSPIDVLLARSGEDASARVEALAQTARRVADPSARVASLTALSSGTTALERPSGHAGSSAPSGRAIAPRWRPGRGPLLGLIGLAALVAAFIVAMRSCSVGEALGLRSWLHAGCPAQPVPGLRADDDPEIEPIPDPGKP